MRAWAAHAKSVSCLAYSSRSGLLASSSRDRAVKLWRLPNHSGAAVGMNAAGSDDQESSSDASPAGMSDINTA